LERADASHVTAWLTECRALLDGLPVLSTLSDGEPALVGGLKSVWSKAPHQLCQLHFMNNLSEPLHEDDRALRQSLKAHLSPLPTVPDLEPEEATARLEHLAQENDAPGKKGGLDASAEVAPAETSVAARDSRFDHLLFGQGAAPTAQEPVAVVQRYYGHYRRAIRDAVIRPSRKPYQCGALRGYDQLVGIGQHLETRRARWGADPYLDALQQRVQAAVAAAAPQAEAVRQARTFLTQVEHYLAQVPRPPLRPASETPSLPTPGSAVVQQELEKRFADFERQAAVGSTAQRLCRKWQTMSPTWLPGILHCYDLPGLPRHNLELEGVFGILRRTVLYRTALVLYDKYRVQCHQRRVSGRQETSPLRVFGPGEIMFLGLEDEEVLPCLQAVPPEAYWFQRRQQEEREEPRRWLRRLRRDPVRALSQLDEQFYEVIRARARAP